MGKKILNQLEAFARWLQLKYMGNRRTSEIVETGRIRFHPQDVKNKVLTEYNKRIKKYG